MVKQKRLSLIAILALIATVFSGCAKAPSSSVSSSSSTVVLSPVTPAISTPQSADKQRVLCLINGTLGDNGFYDNMASGLALLQENLRWETKIIEMGKIDTNYESYFNDASASGEWDLIITATFSVKNLLEKIAVQYPLQKYMIFDAAIDFSVVTSNNVIGITYKNNEAGFLGGALAALMYSEGDNAKIDKASPILGFMGSVDTPHINDFLVGYIDGIKYVNPDLKLLSNYIGSFSDAPKCLKLTRKMYENGAQIIYAPASQSILGAVQACADADKFFIACDNDVWSATQRDDAALASNVLSSTMKNAGNSIFNVAKGLQDGTYKLGQNYVLGLKDGAIGLADNENYRKIVPQVIREKLSEISDKILNNDIVVGSAFKMQANEIATLRDSMKP